MEKFSKEQLETARNAKSSEEIKNLAKENGYDIGDKEADSIYGYLQKHGELQDDELDSISGGGCNDSGDTPKYSVGQEVYIENGLGCWLECVITWVSSTKQTFGLIFKDHEFAYNIKYTVHKKGQTKEGVPESSISTTFHPYNPDLP